MDIDQHSCERIVSSLLNKSNETSFELDSHADSCCIGKHSYVFRDYDRPVSVYGYDTSLGSKEYRTVSAAIGYTHLVTGDVYHLVVCQAIEILQLAHHLLCPMQCRVNDVVVNECPKFLATDPAADTHAIVTQDPENLVDQVILPLSI